MGERGKLNLVLMGGVMHSKSLIQFSVDGWSCVPSLIFTWGSAIILPLWALPGASLVAQMVKHLPTMQETRVLSLGLEAPLGKEMATHSSILAWKIPWTEKPCKLQSMESQRVGHD